MQSLHHQAIIFYDGECGFCDSWVRYIIKHDTKKYFTFCSLHSDLAIEYSKKYYFSIENKDSIALLENGQISRKSLAAKRIATHLNTKINWSAFINFFPIPIADLGYNIISKIRHLLPGSVCEINPEVQSRFIA